MKHARTDGNRGPRRKGMRTRTLAVVVAGIVTGAAGAGALATAAAGAATRPHAKVVEARSANHDPSTLDRQTPDRSGASGVSVDRARVGTAASPDIASAVGSSSPEAVHLTEPLDG